MTTVTSKQANYTKRSWLWIGIALVIVTIIGLGIFYVVDFFHNRAASVAAPLENGLVAAGATKECDSGDPGRGPDNNTAYYRSYFDLQMGKDDAVSLMYRVAKDNGYNLTHASPSNRGHLGAVGDNFIDKWYFDDSRQQSYGDIEAGAIKLAVVVNSAGDKAGCDPTKKIESGHTELGVDVGLPSFKQ